LLRLAFISAGPAFKQPLGSIEESAMIAFVHHKREAVRQHSQLTQGARRPRIIMRRRSRLNPARFLAVVAAVLLFDAISSPTGERIWTELRSSLDDMPGGAVVATVLALGSLAYLAAKIAITRFACSRGVHDAARAKD
jgi:hypothetical protein